VRSYPLPIVSRWCFQREEGNVFGCRRKKETEAVGGGVHHRRVSLRFDGRRATCRRLLHGGVLKEILHPYMVSPEFEEKSPARDPLFRVRVMI
jgi:hypothetical protein